MRQWKLGPRGATTNVGYESKQEQASNQTRCSGIAILKFMAAKIFNIDFDKRKQQLTRLLLLRRALGSKQDGSKVSQTARRLLGNHSLFSDNVTYL